MTLGYIISENKIKIDSFKNDDSLPDNDDLPKIIIGREFSKKLNLKSSILDKKINSNTFWTYSQKEKKSEYVEDIEKFKRFCIDNFLKKINYFFIDPFSLKFSQIKKIIKKFKDSKSGLVYFNSSMCYIYLDKIIFGIHWETIEFLGISKNKIIDWFKRNNFSILGKDEIFNKCMEDSQKLNNIKILPYLYYTRIYDKQDLVGNLS